MWLLPRVSLNISGASFVSN